MAERGRLGRLLRGLLIGGLVLAAVGGGVAAGIYAQYVLRAPGDHLDRDYILSLISRESPVYYRDGETPLGVFFSEQHRLYLTYDEIPTCFVDGLTAAEDRTFFDHPGFSLRGISRAFIQNLKAGRTVAGGSTLTQQTAKNLYKRRSRTYREKLRELLNALRLEAHFSKQDILEFYSNQFYVNGNGRGLGIAARFFFDKEAKDLDRIECAFLAGVVKSPERYNPWVAGEARRERAAEKSRERVAYVLGRMQEEGMLTAAEVKEALAQPIPFSRGQFRFERSVVLDEVERLLRSEPLANLLAAHGVDDPGTSGLQIVTTLDRTAQEGAVYALRHHLTEAGGMLEAPELDSLFLDGLRLKPADPDRIRPKLFHRGRLTAVDVTKGTATVDLGGIEGRLDRAANQRLARVRKRAADKNTWAEPSRKDLQALLKEIEPFVDKGVHVSIREVDEQGPILDWELDTELQGAVLALERGEVRAMVGGSRNSDFNRVSMAKRQFGSTWKPVVFLAALQLRWGSLDPIDNRRGVFPYQGTFYYPRPDHLGAPEDVSMAWAAVKSENLASVRLLSQLSDRLNPEQFRRIADSAGLLPHKGDGRGEFVKRVQAEGLVPTGAALTAGLYRKVRQDLLVDLAFAGSDEEADALSRLPWGAGFADEAERLAKNPDGLPKAELGLRRALLRRSLLGQVERSAEFEERRRALLSAIAEGRDLVDEDTAGLSAYPGTDPIRLSFGDSPEYAVPLDAAMLATILRGARPAELQGAEVAEAASEEGDAASSPEAPESDASDPAGTDGEAEDGGASADPEEESVWDEITPADDDDSAEEPPEPRSSGAGRAFHATTLLDPDRVRLDGLLTPALVARVRSEVEAARAALGESPDLYSPDLLALNADYRNAVHLRYIESLARKAGVSSDIARVLSLPLGSSDITLLEAGLLYQLILAGETFRFFPDALVAAPENAGVELTQPAREAREVDSHVGLIVEIRDKDGRVLYRQDREGQRVHPKEVSAELQAMLGAVVDHGTGRRARGKVRATAVSGERDAELRGLGAVLPLFGKTGTTNSYRNSAFVGFVPGTAATGDRLGAGEGTVVATYVGYDDNREMRRGGIRLAGASGSLPAWIGTAHAAAASSGVGERLDLADLAFSGGGAVPIDWGEGLVPARIDLRTGLPADEAGAAEEPSAEGGTTVVYRRAEPRTFAPVGESP